MTMSTQPARRARVVGRYSPDLARGICARIAKGESLAAVCRERGMPPRSTVDAWKTFYPDFGEAFAAAQAAAGGPARGGRPSGYSVKAAAELCRRLGEGEALHLICRDPEMPSQSGFYLWLHRYPEFAEMYAVAREIQAYRLFDEVREVAEAATPETLQVAKLRIAAIQWQAARLGPKAGEKVREAADGPQPFAIEVVNFLPEPVAENPGED